jgi:hypothetical protein
LIGALSFLGVTALGGGIEMVVFPDGNAYLPAERLERVPLLDSYLVPGLVLGIVFGLGSLVAAVGVARRPTWRWLSRMQRRTGRHWSWTLSSAIGVGFVAWMALELVLVGPDPTTAGGGFPVAVLTDVVFGTVAVLVVVLPWSARVRQDLRYRDPTLAAS